MDKIKIYDNLFIYKAGGDFMNLLLVKDILTEEEARFYIAECVIFIMKIYIF